MTLPEKNSSRNKTPYPYLMNLVSNYLEKNILSNTVKINGIQSRMSLKLWIKVVAFFLGHPVYIRGKTANFRARAPYFRAATSPSLFFLGTVNMNADENIRATVVQSPHPGKSWSRTPILCTQENSRNGEGSGYHVVGVGSTRLLRGLCDTYWMDATCRP